MPSLNQNAINERLKLTATFVNNIGVALLAAGVFVPGISLFSANPTVSRNEYLVIVGGCVVLALALHWSGRRLLERVV